MTAYDDDGAAVLAAFSDLPVRDVDARRARRLATRCRGVLAAQTRPTAAAVETGGVRWTQSAGPVLLAVWCAIYVVEIVRLGAAFLGL